MIKYYHYFNWENIGNYIWYLVKWPLYIVIFVGLAFWIFGCAAFPGAVKPETSESQLLIDQEVERVNAWNEALRKLKARGCYGDALVLVDPYVDSEGNSYFKYECQTYDGTWITLRKFNDRWVIHGE